MKKRLCVITMAVAVSLTGCASVPDLTDEENEMIAQYIAGSILNYDEDYEHGFSYDRSVLDPTPSPSPTAVPLVTDSPSSETDTGTDSLSSQTQSPVENVSLAELYNLSGVQIKQTSSERKKSLDTGYSSLSASGGNELLIVHFQIKNTSGAAKKVNLTKNMPSFSIWQGEKSYGSPLLTILEGEMQYFNKKISAGASEKAVLVFEVPKKFNAKKAVVKAVNGNRRNELCLK